MIYQLFKVAVAGFCLVSLLACIGTGWLWYRSDASAKDVIAVSTWQGRFTLRSGPHGLSLRGPPRAAENATIRDAIKRLRNTDLGWSVMNARFPEGQRKHNWYLNVHAGPRPGSPAKAISESKPGRPFPSICDEAIPLLLMALEDPDRFAAAHVLLFEKWSPLIVFGDIVDQLHRPAVDAERDGNAVTVTYEGLQAKIPADADKSGWRSTAEGDIYLATGVTVSRIDPAQIPAVRKHWHNIFDVTLRSTRYPTVMAVFAAPPLLWLASNVRRRWVLRRRKRQGLCQGCGYDLRANASGICPECGRPATDHA